MTSDPEFHALFVELREIIANENARVGWKDYGDHIRKGGADDLAARVSVQIALQSYLLGRQHVSDTIAGRRGTR